MREFWRFERSCKSPKRQHPRRGGRASRRNPEGQRGDPSSISAFLCDVSAGYRPPPLRSAEKKAGASEQKGAPPPCAAQPVLKVSAASARPAFVRASAGRSHTWDSESHYPAATPQAAARGSNTKGISPE